MIKSDDHILVFGYGMHGQGVVAALRKRGIEVTIVDDSPSEAALLHAAAVGESINTQLDIDELWMLAESVTHLLPTPGLPDSHPIFSIAAESSLVRIGEFDLAHDWDDRPFVGITGTNGKTTVTTMVTEMMIASGQRAQAAGNIDLPLVTAIEDLNIDLFIVEASSFRLGSSSRFSPVAGAWLNFAPDHLDVHASLTAYEEAKAKIWRDISSDGWAIANADDPIVQRNIPTNVRTDNFGRNSGAARLCGDGLELDGVELLQRSQLHRSLPIDVMNALAAALVASRVGASTKGIQAVLQSFRGLKHRVEFVGEYEGIRWYNDSKATSPHATIAGVQGFVSKVLIVGGKNKGIDLEPLAELIPGLRGVVAIGEATGEVVAAFEAQVPVVAAESMTQAVEVAATMARSGDAVVLSPACTSYDWYLNYSDRGDDFTRIVHNLVGASK